MHFLQAQVLNIVYFGKYSTPGGFFPRGISGKHCNLDSVCCLLHLISRTIKYDDLETLELLLAGNTNVVNVTGAVTTSVCSGALSMASLSAAFPMLLAGLIVIYSLVL